MAHVYALSRRVYYLESFPLERELEFRQLQDPNLQEISNQLEFSDSDKFKLIEGLVYRKEADRSRFVIPNSIVNNMIRIHDEQMAHCNMEKTYQGIYKSYWFPSMRKRIRDHIDNCVTCLLADAASNSKEGEMQVSQMASNPLEILHLDHFGPLQQTEEGYKHVLVVVDAFSRFTWLFSVRSTGSRKSCDFSYIGYSIPTALLSF